MMPDDNMRSGKKLGMVSRLRLLVAKPVHRQLRGMTLGARVAVIDSAGRFLLVRHTYSEKWIFPGGGVERGETCRDAALREIREEAAILATGPLILRGIFSNHEEFPGDHLAFYELKEFKREDFKPNSEIAAAEFFLPDELPEKLNAGTRRRIAEIRSGVLHSDYW